MKTTMLNTIACIAMLFALEMPQNTYAQELQLNQFNFAPGSAITLTFSAPSGLPNNAWIGIIPANIPHGSEAVNDQHDISYQYLDGKTAGVMQFTAPNQAGSYEFRMNDTDADGHEIASIGFSIGNTGEVYLETDKRVYSPGGKITVSFGAESSFAENAWIGIIPSSVEHGNETVNDQHDISYQYLKSRTSGVITFEAPTSPGDYDLRMHNTDDSGDEVASVSISVIADVISENASLILDRDYYAPGETIIVNFTAPATFTRDAWIGIIPAEVPHGNEATNDEHDLSYKYIEQRTHGSYQFVAPSKPGRYDFRMHNSDSNGIEVSYVSFVVE